MTDTLALALDYLTWHPDRFLFPIEPGRKTPPKISDNLKSASNDPAQIKKWAAKFPGCFWGLSHEKSGLIVVDVDRKPGKSGQITYDVLSLDHDWPPTETNSTPSGGLHYVYKAEWFYKLGKHSFALGENGFGTNIDSPHYSLIPGQTLATGGSYEAVSDAAPATAPKWFAEYLGRAKTHESAAGAEPVIELDTPDNVKWAIAFLKSDDAPKAIEGKNGDITTFKVACQLRGHGISEDKARELMEAYYNVPAKCDPIWPLDGDKGLHRKIANAYEYASIDAPGEDTAQSDFPGAVELTDAERIESEQRRKERLAKAEKEKIAHPIKGSRTIGDFIGYLPEHKYIFKLTGALWPPESVNATVGKGTTRKLDKQCAVDVLTWAPGYPQVIEDMVVAEKGGWFKSEGKATFNRYTPPKIPRGGEADQAGRWRDHLRMIYPDNADHIEKWLAHRVQKPGDKINHALVLGGYTRTGKDTLLEPVKEAIGPWNFGEITASQAMDPKNNGFLETVILRISEARDFGDRNRFAFYEHWKPWLASPPDVISCADKYIKAHPIINCFGAIITTNHKVGGLFLPLDDARHYVAWSDLTREEIDGGKGPNYFPELWAWYRGGGINDVIAFLRTLDISKFDAKGPPPRTPAFFAMAQSFVSTIDLELGDVIETLPAVSGEGPVEVFTINQVIQAATISDNYYGIAESLQGVKNNTQVARRLMERGFEIVPNPHSKDGRWRVGGGHAAIYGRSTLPPSERLRLAAKLAAA